MKINNFKKIQEEDEQRYAGSFLDIGRAGIWGTLGVYKFVGQLVEVYVPRAVDVLICAAGARSSHKNRPPDAPGEDGIPGGPAAPDSGRA